MERMSMERKEATNSAEVYALSKMDPLAKRAANAQVILMYERLAAGKKTIEDVFDQMVSNTVDMGMLDMRMLNCTQSMAGEMNESKVILTDMQQQQEKIRELEEQLRISHNFFREALEEARKENKNIYKMCNQVLKTDKTGDMNDVSSYEELKKQMKEMQKSLEKMFAEQKQMGKNFQEMMEYFRIYQSGMNNLQKKNDSLFETRNNMKKIADKNQVITKSFAELSAQIGKMAQDRFYMMDNSMFKSVLSTAVVCHKEWMRTFRRYVDTGKETDLQFDWRLSGFGICYLAVYPRHREITKEWQEIGQLHEQIHRLANESTKKVKKGDLEGARMVYEHAKDMSEILLQNIDLITRKLKGIQKRKENIFEN